MVKFSVLVSVYYKESPSNLEECFRSLINQTLKAAEIILVKDGILTPELENVINLWHNNLPLIVVGYEENRGIAYALNYGLEFVSCELVARVDTDDICLSDRFEKQISYFEKNKNIVLLSGYISEFNEQPNDIISIRKVPVGHLEIIKYLKKRNAFNHMAVMFRKSAIRVVGSYQEINGFEDYDLWIRLVQAGYKVDNLSEILVYARIGNDMISRRTGFQYVKKEFYFLYKQRKRHFISNYEFISLILFRLPVRFIPKKMLQYIYYKIFRNG
jgi:glycosyltransferase involved in cell wall biosynthesis